MRFDHRSADVLETMGIEGQAALDELVGQEVALMMEAHRETRTVSLSAW